MLQIAVDNIVTTVACALSHELGADGENFDIYIYMCESIEKGDCETQFKT